MDTGRAGGARRPKPRRGRQTAEDTWREPAGRAAAATQTTNNPYANPPDNPPPPPPNYNKTKSRHLIGQQFFPSFGGTNVNKYTLPAAGRCAGDFHFSTPTLLGVLRENWREAKRVFYIGYVPCRKPPEAVAHIIPESE